MTTRIHQPVAPVSHLHVLVWLTWLACAIVTSFFTLTAGRGVRVFLLAVWDHSCAVPSPADWGRATRRLCYDSVCNLDDQSDHDHRLKATERWRLHDFDQHVFDAGVGVASTTNCLLAWYPKAAV